MKGLKTASVASGLAGLRENFKSDALSGFLVFLIALPLCLGISMASGFPPVAGILTAIIGGMVVSFLGGSELTIKGPAAGLIVIALGAVGELGQGDSLLGYKLALATIVVAGVIQILFGTLRSGVLGDFFPAAAVSGMLASIGIIIISKQVFTLLGVKPAGKEPLELLVEIPLGLANLNPQIAIIGVTSLLILFTLPLLKNKYLKRVPAPLLVILVSIPLGHLFGLAHSHTYLFLDEHNYSVGPEFLVTLPKDLLSAITFPDFSQVFSGTSIKYIIMFAVVGSLESILSTKAVDTLDPYKRKANLNRDMVGVGIGNTLAGLIGGLPMISEIVRSSANINSGGKTRWANFFHGLFLLLFVALAPGLIHQIPLAALAAMLIYTGFRLASPTTFIQTFHKGWEQLVIFLITIIFTLSTDLLVGIGAGIAAELLILMIKGLPVKSIFKPGIKLQQHEDNDYIHIALSDGAVFSNYIRLRKYLDSLPRRKHLVLDFSDTVVVDHTVMKHLHQYREEYTAQGGWLEITGLHGHKPVSKHPHAARVRVQQRRHATAAT
ncbi:SulP family inorganic anion transporter [Pontibacter pamirensis]|uniref:SulP family inorganic anion transporter n=1 Tax=Pontibacter pamirensis TaxID=2562824 RepID=UPI00138A0076|nr:SulP family inorganic anion transporter [Pontibacter pamirensis]